MVRGKNLGISTKQAAAICKFIKGKKIGRAISELEAVMAKKRALPMKGEIPHRRGNIMSGRYPYNSSKAFIALLKSLDANANFSNVGDSYIETAKADIASRPYKRGGSRRFKRSNVLITVKRIVIKNQAKESKGKK